VNEPPIAPKPIPLAPGVVKPNGWLLDYANAARVGLANRVPWKNIIPHAALLKQ
jgi:hypothetical protein